jgi:hypothetical protein
MPLSGSAKKDYNDQYYSSNSEKIQARRLIKSLESGKQKTIRLSTLEKYKDGFTSEEYAMMTQIAIRPVTLTPKKTPEGPAPGPVLEDPGPSEAPAKKTKSKSSKKEFTLDDVRAVIEEHASSKGSAKTYTDRLPPLMKLLGPEGGSEDFSLIFKRNTIDQIIQKLSSHYKRPSQHIQTLLYIFQRAKALQSMFRDSEAMLTRLRKEMRIQSDREKVVGREERLNDKTDYVGLYNKIFQIEKDLAKKEKGSQDHLISLMYTRAVYGNTKKELRLIPRNYFWAVRMVESDDQIIRKKKDGENWYNVNSGLLVIQNYKTTRKYDPVDLYLNSHVRKVIRESYAKNPRKYLFETPAGKPYTDNFRNQINRVLGIGIDIYRRAIINYELQVAKRPRDEISQSAAHSVETNELVYQAGPSS